CSRNGTTFYLDRGCEWTTDPEMAWEYEEYQDADRDMRSFGGEVFEFKRLMRRTDAESFTGHNEAARLERAYLEAAE
ncbi:hypothetical protein IB244_31655, partial [Rhizobium sp. RHZ02]|uniref:hypothetical protein n=1 Tax=Rhizobium sp. RHZ02 TaxID=2769306 RepID=UPI0017839256